MGSKRVGRRLQERPRTGGAEGVEATKKAYAAALETASEKFWRLSALQPSWNFEHLTGILSSQAEWPVDCVPAAGQV